MIEEFEDTPRDTFLAPTKRKPRVSFPPRCAESGVQRRKKELLDAAQKSQPLLL